MKRVALFVFLCTLVVGCHANVPVKQTMMQVADSVTALSGEVLLVQKLAHDATLGLCRAGSPASVCLKAIAVDQKVQQGATDYAKAADQVLAKVQAATTTSEAVLVSVTPLITKAQTVYDAFGGSSFAPIVDAELSKLHALLLSLQ